MPKSKKQLEVDFAAELKEIDEAWKKYNSFKAEKDATLSAEQKEIIDTILAHTWGGRQDENLNSNRRSGNKPFTFVDYLLQCRPDIKKEFIDCKYLNKDGFFIGFSVVSIQKKTQCLGERDEETGSNIEEKTNVSGDDEDGTPANNVLVAGSQAVQFASGKDTERSGHVVKVNKNANGCCNIL